MLFFHKLIEFLLVRVYFQFFCFVRHFSKKNQKMLIKAASLSRSMLLKRSVSILNSSRTLSTNSLVLKTKTDLIFLTSKPTELNKLASNQIHSSGCTFQNNPTDKNPIQKPVFSPELQEILNSSQKKQASEAGNEDQASDSKDEPKEEKKGLAKAFSREHGWKTSLALFGGIFVGASVYTLFSWGAPNLDENGQPVIKANIFMEILFTF